jgi:spermidine synthase
MKDWVTEIYAPMGNLWGLEAKEKLHSEKTEYQQIDMYDTTYFGKVMLIDGCMQLTTYDNFLYHEMMTHPVLFTHPNPLNVVVIGGGDCGTLQQVLLHSQVKTAKQIEIDKRVTDLAEIYFPELCANNKDPRAELIFGDGIAWMLAQPAASLDVIIVDSTDPVGPAEGLFNRAFYQSCLNALRPNGLLVQQSESPLFHLELMRSMRKAMHDAGFTQSHTLLYPQPCYPSGWWSCTIAGREGDITKFREADAEKRSFKTRYYSPAIHKAALANPPFMSI